MRTPEQIEISRVERLAERIVMDKAITEARKKKAIKDEARRQRGELAYQKIRDKLIANGKFKPKPKQVWLNHKLKYIDVDTITDDQNDLEVECGMVNYRL